MVKKRGRKSKKEIEKLISERIIRVLSEDDDQLYYCACSLVKPFGCRPSFWDLDRDEQRVIEREMVFRGIHPFQGRVFDLEIEKQLKAGLN
jgi:hypothetical protein